jgi:gluconate 5-dehydrogenase
MKNLFDLSGKRALITGSARGIGYLLAEGLAEYGAEIIINDRTQQKADAAAQALRAQGYRATGVALMSPAASRLNRPLRGLRRRSGRLIF